jgi:hypothetical protein
MNFAELWAVRGFRLNIIGGIILMLIGSPIVYMAFDRVHPYEFLAEGSAILPPEAEGGDQVTVYWKVKYNRTCTGSVRRVLFDPTTKVETQYSLENAAIPSNSLREGYLRKTFLLPRDLAPGWWGYRSDLCYICNPLQDFVTAARVCYSTPDLFFKVRK